MRPFPGWIIRREGDEIVVMAPQANPGMLFVHPTRGRLADRLLFALADAVLRSDDDAESEAPHLPPDICPPASRGLMRMVAHGCACDPTGSDGQTCPAPDGRPLCARGGSLPSLSILDERPGVPA